LGLTSRLNISIYTDIETHKEVAMTKLDGWIRRFNTQMDQLRPEGYVLQGSVMKRYLQRPTRRGSKTCGPYFLWTRKIRRKTVTRALTAEQAQIIREAIRRNRLLEQRVAKLRALSELIIYAVTPCVARRKRVA
jgi:hypothetical protein